MREKLQFNDLKLSRKLVRETHAEQKQQQNKKHELFKNWPCPTILDKSS